MPGITAILHTHNDALRIARAVESLRPCDEVLVIDHASSDDTCHIARAFGTRVIVAQADEANPRHSHQEARHQREELYLQEAQHDWILCLLPTESVGEGLEASLLEWKLEDPPTQIGFGASILEESPEGWIPHPAETRLAHRKHARWDGWKPLTTGTQHVLDGYLTRFRMP